jgi:hypothetical protein
MEPYRGFAGLLEAGFLNEPEFWQEAKVKKKKRKGQALHFYIVGLQDLTLGP